VQPVQKEIHPLTKLLRLAVATLSAWILPTIPSYIRWILDPTHQVYGRRHTAFDMRKLPDFRHVCGHRPIAGEGVSRLPECVN
jgi:hypothetical protein